MNARYIVNITLQLMLDVRPRIVRCAPLRRRVALASKSDVLVFPHLLFAQAAQNFVLVVSQTLDPVAYVLHHLPLHQGIGIMEVWVEKALKHLFGHMMNIHRRVVPCLHNEFNCVTDDDLCNVPCGLIKNEIEMVL